MPGTQRRRGGKVSGCKRSNWNTHAQHLHLPRGIKWAYITHTFSRGQAWVVKNIGVWRGYQSSVPLRRLRSRRKPSKPPKSSLRTACHIRWSILWLFSYVRASKSSPLPNIWKRHLSTDCAWRTLSNSWRNAAATATRVWRLSSRWSRIPPQTWQPEIQIWVIMSWLSDGRDE